MADFESADQLRRGLLDSSPQEAAHLWTESLGLQGTAC